MITVIKRKGREQGFDLAKIETSIFNAARDVGVPMSEKECQLAASDVLKKILALRGEEAKTSSYEIRELVEISLAELGFKKVAEAFERGKPADQTDIERHVEAIRMHRQALKELGVNPHDLE